MSLAMLNLWFRRVKEGSVSVRRRLATGSAILSLLPLSLLSPIIAIDSKDAVWRTELVLADTSPDLLKPADDRFNIETTVSRYQEEQARLAEAERTRIASARLAQRNSRRETDVPRERKVTLAQQAAVAYGVPAELLQAVWQIESGMRWFTDVRSSAGATGPFQFMPGTWQKYATDGNGDGVRDVRRAEDAAYGAARLLAANGASDGDYRRALRRYNNAEWYVDKVLSLAGM